MQIGELKIFSGSSNYPLSERIAQELEQPLGNVQIKRFPDGEIGVKYEESVRGADLFIIQSTCSPADNILELLIMMDAAKRASARRITAVIPYFGYARQDRKDKPRVPISGKLMANLITAAGADRILTIDLHAPQIQGFFDIPVDHLTATNLFSAYFQKNGFGDLLLVAPDLGRFKSLADELEAPGVLVVKNRTASGTIEIYDVIGDVKDKNLLIVDDIVSSGNTLLEAISVLKTHGARDIYVAVTHALFSANGVQMLHEAAVSQMVVTDTVHIPQEKRFPKLTILTVAPLLAEAILRIHRNQSVSVLYQSPIGTFVKKC